MITSIQILLFPILLIFPQDGIRVSPIDSNITLIVNPLSPKDTLRIMSRDSGIVQMTYKTLRGLANSIGKQAPPLLFIDITNRSSHELSNFKGKIVLLNFWSRSCKPCIDEMPDISYLQDEYEKAGLKVIFLGEDIETQNRFFKNQEISGMKAQVIDDNSFLPIYGDPTLILIDRDGTIKDIWMGSIGYDSMEKRINALIPKEFISFRFHNPRLVLLSSIVLFGLCLIVIAFVWNKKRKKPPNHFKKEEIPKESRYENES
jgi:thiol-disulfide isomerase/thioredoxin